MTTFKRNLSKKIQVHLYSCFECLLGRIYLQKNIYYKTQNKIVLRLLPDDHRMSCTSYIRK
jgi:hypothetical protein